MAAGSELECVCVEGNVDNETLINCVRRYRSIYDKMFNNYRVPPTSRGFTEVVQ